MKKFLSLVLALVMTMSLVTVSAGAKEYTDDGKINYDEAVDVVSAVKVVDGYADGSFNPTNTLTRGAAAKIICNLILGPTAASALHADAAPYKDVAANHVFAGYIAYCQQMGIISGYADGSFRPAGTLTSYAFMKMLLGALGYDQKIEGYVGNNWSIAVAKRALAIDLDAGLKGEFVGVKAVTREEACLYAFNALNAEMVKYDTKGTNIEINGVIINQGASAAEGTDELFREVYFKDLKLTNVDADNFGRPAVQWKNGKKIVGTYAETADKVYTDTVKTGDIYFDLDLEENGKYTVTTNGKTSMMPIEINRGSKTELAGSCNTVTTEVYEDAETIVMYNTYVGKITATHAEDRNTDAYVKVAGLAAQDGVNYTFYTEDYDEFAKKDIVLYTVANGKVQSVELADSVSGEVTKFSSKNGATIDGETYAIAAGVKMSAGDEVVAYMTENGVIIYTDAIASLVNDMYYVVALGESRDSISWGGEAEVTYYAKVLAMDGTLTTVTLKEKTKANVGDFVHMSLDSDEKATLKAINPADFTNVASQELSGKVITSGKPGKANGVSYNNETLFVLYNADDKAAKVYTGYKAVPTVDTTKPVTVDVLQKATGSKTAAVVYVDVTNASATVAKEDALYLLGGELDYVSTTEKSYYEVPAVQNGKMTTVLVNEKETAVINELKADKNVLVVSYNLDEGVIEAIKTEDSVVVTSYEAGVLTYADKTLVADADVTTVYCVTDGNLDVVTVEDVELAGKSVHVVLNDDKDTVEAIYMEEV